MEHMWEKRKYFGIEMYLAIFQTGQLNKNRNKKARICFLFT